MEDAWGLQQNKVINWERRVLLYLGTLPRTIFHSLAGKPTSRKKKEICVPKMACPQTNFYFPAPLNRQVFLQRQEMSCVMILSQPPEKGLALEKRLLCFLYVSCICLRNAFSVVMIAPGWVLPTGGDYWFKQSYRKACSELSQVKTKNKMLQSSHCFYPKHKTSVFFLSL